jgi:hypothetical protein
MIEGGVGISASDWAKGIILSVLASLVGGASKLAIRKSWLLQEGQDNSTITRATTDAIGPVEGSATNAAADDDDLLSSYRFVADGVPFTATPASPCCCSGGGGQRLWLPYTIRYCGMVGMSVLNPICCVLAMNYASPSILAPFSGLTLVWVIVGSKMVNSEQPSHKQIWACCWIILGEVIVAVFGDHTNDEGVTVEDVVRPSSWCSFSIPTGRDADTHLGTSVSFLCFGRGISILGWSMGTYCHHRKSPTPNPPLSSISWACPSTWPSSRIGSDVRTVPSSVALRGVRVAGRSRERKTF